MSEIERLKNYVIPKHTVNLEEESGVEDNDLHALSSLCEDLNQCLGGGDIVLDDLDFSLSPKAKRGSRGKKQGIKKKKKVVFNEK